MEHQLHCDADRFWALFFDMDFNPELFAALGLPRWKLLDTVETEGEVHPNGAGDAEAGGPGSSGSAGSVEVSGLMGGLGDGNWGGPGRRWAPGSRWRSVMPRVQASSS